MSRSFDCFPAFASTTSNPWVVWAIGAILLICTPALAADGFCARVTGVASDDTLKIRNKPNPSGDVLGKIAANGRDIFVTGEFTNNGNSKWARIFSRFSLDPGWVNSRFLQRDDGGICNTETLFSAGISLRYAHNDDQLPPGFYRGGSSHPNKCPFPIASTEVEVSVSDNMLASFKGRGFTLDTLCLAITAPMTNDPETGVPLPIVPIMTWSPSTRFNWVLLNIPDCFARGIPFLDCKIYNHWFWGGNGENRDDEPLSWADSGRKIEQLARKAMTISPKPRVIREDDAAKILGGDEKAWQLYDNRIDMIVISPNYPKGYAYRLATAPSRGDDAEFDTRSRGTTSSTRVSAPWNRQ